MELEREQLERKINRQEHEIKELRERNGQLQRNFNELNERFEGDQLRWREKELKIIQNENLSLQQQKELSELKETSETQKMELDFFSRVLYSHASTSQSKDQIALEQKQHFKDIFQKYIDLETENEKIKRENILLNSEQEELKFRLTNSQTQCQEIQKIYQLRIEDFQQHYQTMSRTIAILSKQIEDDKQFQQFITNQVKLNESQLKDTAAMDDIEEINSNKNIHLKCGNKQQKKIHLMETNLFQENNDLYQDNLQSYVKRGSHMMIDEDEEKQCVKQLEDENEQLNKQMCEYEMKVGVKMMEKESQISDLNIQVKQLQDRNEEMRIANQRAEEELRKLSDKRESEELCKLRPSELSLKDVEILQYAYLQEKVQRQLLQSQLSAIQEEMQRKNPILRRQNEKWLKLNQEFIKFEEEHSNLQQELIKTEKLLETIQTELRESQQNHASEQKKTEFLKEEIQRLAAQIQQLLKVNLKLKQSISSRLGKQQLDEIIAQIRKDKNQPFGLKEADILYSSQFSSLYTDIEEIVEMNNQLTKMLRNKHM